MKISLISDLHLEISGHLTLPGGDVLIIAGDACEVKNLSKEFHSTKPSPYISGMLPCYDFFKTECSKYNKVFYVMGNHEHYKGRFDKTRETLQSMLPNNVSLLDKDYEIYNDVVFVGATLWTDCNKRNPLTLNDLKCYMNDYRVITNWYSDKGSYFKLIPEITIREHEQTLAYFKNICGQYPDKKLVVISHHAPSYESINEMYTNDYHMNGGYASDLSDLILDNQNIKVWVHGHMHDPVDYLIGQTRVLCNPRGYIPYEGHNGFDPNLTFEV